MKLKLLAVISLTLVAISGLPFKAQALTLVPPTLEFGSQPGEEIISKIRVINESAETVSLLTSTANFTAKDETGNPHFLFEEKEGLADWINISPSPIILLPGERQDVPFSIKVPENAEPGGHYAAIFFSSSRQPAAGEEGQIALVAKLGTLMLLRVAGDIETESALLEFNILDNRRFFTRLPVDFWYRLRNVGNLHIRPFGNVEIRNILGLSSAKVPANPVEGAVLPDSVRRFETKWQRSEPPKIEYKNFLQYFWQEAGAEMRNFALGRYTAQLKFINVPGVDSGSKLSFWVFPWRFLLLVFLFLVISGWLIINGIKKYNAWIIGRAKGLESRK